MIPVISLPVDVIVQLKSTEDSAPSPPVKPRQITFEDQIPTATNNYNEGGLIAEDIRESNNESASSSNNGNNTIRVKENREPLRSRTEMKKFPTQQLPPP